MKNSLKQNFLQFIDKMPTRKMTSFDEINADRFPWWLQRYRSTECCLFGAFLEQKFWSWNCRNLQMNSVVSGSAILKSALQEAFMVKILILDELLMHFGWTRNKILLALNFQRLHTNSFRQVSAEIFQYSLRKALLNTLSGDKTDSSP